METTILLNNDTCIKCGRCVKICPSVIFQHTDNKSIITKNTATCIGCGHCVSVCPTSSITHSLFSAQDIHKFSYSDYPTPEQMLLLLKSRRSNRSISQKPVPQSALDTIIEAAHRAPTASNMQQVDFTLVTDPKKLELITNFTLDVFGNIIKKIDNPILRPIVKRLAPNIYRYVPMFKMIQAKLKNEGENLILRNATAILLIHAPIKSRFNSEDTNLAYQNASIMAECLGLSNIYMGFVLTATRQKRGKLEQMFNIDGKIGAILALGVPNFKYEYYIDKKPISLNKF